MKWVVLATQTMAVREDSCKRETVSGKTFKRRPNSKAVSKWPNNSFYLDQMIKASRQKKGIPQVTLLHAHKLCIPDEPVESIFLSMQ